MEIERKFRLTSFPDLPEESRLEQWQGYLCTGPDAEVRVRRTVDHTRGTREYILCVKSIGDLSRHQVEAPLTQAQFEELEGMLKYPLIHKEMRVYALPGDLHLECAMVDEGAFAYAEVEFPTEKAARAWTPPDCLGREMTYERQFRMREYWSDRSLARQI